MSISTHTRCRPGDLPQKILPGDIGLVYDHKPSATHELIHARNRQIAGGTEWANLTHSFCVVDEDGSIVEALSEGMMLNNVSKYKDADFWIIHVNATPEQRQLAVRRVKRQLGLKYDFLAFVSEGMLCFGWPISIRSTNLVYICSGLACFMALAYEVSFPRPFDLMTPCEIGMYFNLPIHEAPAPMTFTGRVLDRVVTVGKLIGGLFK
jgi:hypothetical protein